MKRTLLTVALALAGLFLASGAGAGPGAKPRPKAMCLGKPATIVGKAGADFLVGTPRADVIAGIGGNDRIEAGGGNDLICGGVGSDILVGGAGVDRIDGGPGFDTCRTAERLATCEETRPALPQDGMLAAGQYVTDLLTPHVSFQLGAGWVSGGDAPTGASVFYERRAERGIAFDSVSSGRPVAEVVAGVAAEPLMNATPASPVTIGGAPGQRFEIRTAEVGRLVQVPGMGRGLALPGGLRARLDVVSAAGHTVTILTITPGAQFESFLPLADEVLATVKFRP
jgi:hypothetical protein